MYVGCCVGHCMYDVVWDIVCIWDVVWDIGSPLDSSL